MKVKIFKEYSPNWLEENINAWLRENQNIKVFDIKYCSFLFERQREKVGCYTAMIIYKELKSFGEININEDDLPFSDGGVN